MSTPGREPFDVAYIGDFRKDSTAASLIADEISLQAKAGYSTVLLPLERPGAVESEAVHPVLDALVRAGQASLADSGEAALEGELTLRDSPWDPIAKLLPVEGEVSSRLSTAMPLSRDITLEGKLDPEAFWPHIDTIGGSRWPGTMGGPRR